MDEDYRVWRSVSPAAKQLISGALVVDRSRRCDIYDMWAHPWLNGATAAMAPSVAVSPLGDRGSGVRLAPQNSPGREQMRKYEVKKRLRATMTVVRAVGRMSAMRRASSQNQGAIQIETDDDDDEMMLLDESI